MTLVSVFTDISRIILLLNGYNIVVIQSVYLFFNILKMIYILYYMKKKYSWIDLKVVPNYQAISQKNAVLVHQISGLIFNNTDVVILTFFCGLKFVSIYSIYASVYSIINNFISITSTSVQSALGQIYNSDIKRFFKIQDIYETVFLSLVFSLFTVATILVLPFLSLYTSGADINYIDKYLPILFTLFQLLNYGRTTSGQIISFAGEFSSTKFRAIIESVINLTVSFICVFNCGIYGVLIGTIAALFYRANDMILFANRRILNRSAFPTYKRWGINFIIFVVCLLFFNNFSLDITSYFNFFGNAIWISMIVFSIYFIAMLFYENSVRIFLLDKFKALFFKI